MKKILLLSIFTIITFVSACSYNNESSSLKILKWGPDEAKIGTIPNKQPDGKMGIWIDVLSTEGIGEVQVLFAGKPQPTVIEPKLITAGVVPEDISVAGDKKIEIKLVSTGQIIPVGTFKIVP